MIAPKIIKKPIELIVFPNPCLSTSTILCSGKVAIASNKDTANNDIKAFNLITDVNSIIKMILNTTSMEIVIILIILIFVINNCSIQF